jgi:hypothetical protein
MPNDTAYEIYPYWEQIKSKKLTSSTSSKVEMMRKSEAILDKWPGFQTTN